MVNKVGVVIPVWNTKKNNRTKLLKDAVASALAQDIDFRLQIVDNGSIVLEKVANVLGFISSNIIKKDCLLNINILLNKMI